MKILWFTWKDMRHPLAGGAEVVNEELAKRLAADGHDVIFIVGGFKGGAAKEERDGFTIVRLGNRWTVYWKAYRYYKKNLQGWADIVIDEVNTIPFFAKFYAREKNILFVHQLCREIWFYQMFFPLNVVGYLLEPLYLWLLRDRQVITVSESSKQDLARFGFKAENIDIISEGIQLEPVKDLTGIKKFEKPTILSLGAIRPMKRTADIVRAFEIAKKKVPDLELVISGDAAGSYGQKVLRMIEMSPYKGSIRYEGRVPDERKVELMQKAHFICVTSVKEGWGLIVTEAASQGTPAIVYDVDGLRDSVQDGETGFITKENTPEAFAGAIGRGFSDRAKYAMLGENALEKSQMVTFGRGYRDLKEVFQKWRIR